MYIYIYIYICIYMYIYIYKKEFGWERLQQLAKKSR